MNIKTRVKRRHVARCAGLARLPEVYIKKGLSYIMNKSPRSEDVTKFNKYFRKQWMTKTDFAKVCCCSKENIRTTNNIEGWHSRINRFVAKKSNTGTTA